MVKILIVMGNPKNNSLCQAISNEFANGAINNGHEVSIFNCNEFTITTPAPNDANYHPEEWVKQQQKALIECDHIVFVTPLWWGSMTASLKSYIDQVFLSGIAYKYNSNGSYDKLMKNKTSEVIITSDTPEFYYNLFIGAPLRKIFKVQILEFCGFKFKRFTMFSPVTKSVDITRQKWLKKAYSLGKNAI